MYEEFYGLRDKPFALAPDPRFFYASKGHKRAMAYLEYGVQQGEGFIVITGEIGAGKTTLARNLFAGISEQPLAAAQLVSTQLDAGDLLRSVCLAFGLDQVPSDKSEQLRALEWQLQCIRQRGERALLIVDEAQNLGEEAVEELRMLSNFQDEQGSLLQSFLLGQPEFRRILRSSHMQQLRQRVIATYHLGPMDEDDSRAYIEHRLAQVDWQGDPQFTEATWPMIHRYTGGIPRRINTLCDRLLLMGYLEELHTLTVRDVQAVIDEMEADFGAGEETSTAASTGKARSQAGKAGAGFQDEGLESRLQRIERFLGFNYRVVERVIDIHREEQNRVDERLDRIERYIVLNYRLSRQIEAMLRNQTEQVVTNTD
jgi:putative secretion ATPase (PEP-CTERM system associated)